MPKEKRKEAIKGLSLVAPYIEKEGLQVIEEGADGITGTHISEIINRFKLAEARVKAKGKDRLFGVNTELGDGKTMSTNWFSLGSVQVGEQLYPIFTGTICWVHEPGGGLMQV